MIKKADVILAVVLIVLSVTVIAVSAFAEADGKTVVISVDNEAVAELPLDSNTVKTIENEYGRNTVAIKDGEVTVTDADCPDGYCEKHVAIKSDGETIVCLPHRLAIEIRN